MHASVSQCGNSIVVAERIRTEYAKSKKGRTIMPALIGQYDQHYLALVAVAGTIPTVILLLWLSQRSKYAEFIRSYRGIAPNFLRS